MIGDCDHYFSPYIFGVNQAMSRLGHWHSQVNIRNGIDAIAARINDVKPDIIWTHMLLWAPPGSPPVDRLVNLMEREAKRGCKVVIHDGDYKEGTRFARDISSWCAAALCNHKFDRTAWKVTQVYWPYFAFAQDKIAEAPTDKHARSLFFAGIMTANDATYGARTALLCAVRAKGVDLQTPAAEDGNTLFRTPEISASMGGVLGFGRPGGGAWRDTRVDQYGGSGAILLHDDAPNLEPWVHFAPYTSGSADSVAETFQRVLGMSPVENRTMRERVFRFVQEKHSSVARVSEVLGLLFGGAA